MLKINSNMLFNFFFIFLDDVVQLIDLVESSKTVSQDSNYSENYLAPGPSEAKRPRASHNIINEKLVATLDKCRVSNRNAVRIIISVAESLGIDPNSIIINRTSISDYRQQMREKLAAKVKEKFSSFHFRSIDPQQIPLSSTTLC